MKGTSATSGLYKRVWLLKRPHLWREVPEDDLHDRESEASRRLVEEARKDGLYKASTQDWAIWHWLGGTARSLRRREARRRIPGSKV